MDQWIWNDFARDDAPIGACDLYPVHDSGYSGSWKGIGVGYYGKWELEWWR